MTRCPVCAIPWPAPIACCPCGFAPSAIDDFVVQVRLQRRRGVWWQLIGASTAGLAVPLGWLVSSSLAWVLILPVVGASLLVGAVVFGCGTRLMLQSTRRLRNVAELRQLPAARVVDG